MSGASSSALSRWLGVWRLTPDGAPIRTRTSRLLPVRTGDGELAMLKVATGAEERAGVALLAWWDGQGAARILEHEDEALLLERATGWNSLAEMARSGRDDEATHILCAATHALHAQTSGPPSGLVPLDRWFASLFRSAETQGGLLAACAATARDLLSDPLDAAALHGDIHHGNVLDFGARGWLAIDPKGLIGERGFDYANMFCNPDRETAREPGRLRSRLDIVSSAADLDRARLLKWIMAWSALSEVWKVEDGEADEPDFAIAALAAAELEVLS